MKFTIVAALMGLSQGVSLNEATKMKNSESSKMHDLCKSVHGIAYPHESVLIQLEESTLPIADKRSTGAPEPAAPTV